MRRGHPLGIDQPEPVLPYARTAPPPASRTHRGPRAEARQNANAVVRDLEPLRQVHLVAACRKGHIRGGRKTMIETRQFRRTDLMRDHIFPMASATKNLDG